MAVKFDKILGKLRESDVTTPDLSGLVPYTGATSPLDLGDQNLELNPNAAIIFDNNGADQVTIGVSPGNLLAISGSMAQAFINMENLTSARTIEIPDADGKLALEATGVTDTFTTADAKTVTVTNGIITSIV